MKKSMTLRALRARRRSSMTFLFELHGAGKDDLRATGLEVSVHVAESQGAPTPVPDGIRKLVRSV